MLGTALLFTGISLALLFTTGMRRMQAEMLAGLYRQASGSQENEPADAADRQPELCPGRGE